MAAFTDKSDQELIHDLFDSERGLMAARIRHSMNQLENTAELKVLRRRIARLHTEARRRELEQGLLKDSLIHAHRQTYVASADGAEQGSAEKGGFLSGIVDKLAGQE